MESELGNGSFSNGVPSLASAKDRRVGLIYDDRMCGHYNSEDLDHPECPGRISAIWERLKSSGLTERCIALEARYAEETQLGLVHSKDHVNLINNIISYTKSQKKRNQIAEEFNSIYFSEGSSKAASLAAGSVVEVMEKVAKGELDSGFAIVRPPGHHAEESEPMGFCLYNNIAVATSYVLNKRVEVGIKKILIVDWDVHHGNGTQKMFYADPRVLFFSVHRHDFGTFYPGGDDGSYEMTGEGPGAGYNINVPWEGACRGDADYLAVWDHVLIPVAKEFNPDMIVISAGFDSALGDPLGGCLVTPLGYSIMLQKLMEFSNGKIVMALEGGYNLDAIAESAKACVEVLLQDKPLVRPLEMNPLESTWRVISQVCNELSVYWPVLGVKLNEKFIDEVEIIGDDVLKPFEGLKLAGAIEEKEANSSLCSWRSEFSKIYLWYATYGSNMNVSRFRCYIEGGQTEGMRRPCVGSRDKSIPEEILWKAFPHRLFFGRERTATWGPGGVAFLHPKSNTEEKAYLCLYKITLEQFNDVLLQENTAGIDVDRPIFDLAVLQTVQKEKSITIDPYQENAASFDLNRPVTDLATMDSFENGWYKNIVYLGTEQDLPILTMTCTLSDVDGFVSGQFPVNPPAKEYADTLIKGLVLGNQLSEEEASVYMHEASTKPL